MKQEIHRYQCNNCDKTREIDKLNPLIGGGNPFRGWFHVSGESDMYCHNEDKGPWDFCCHQCMVEYFSKKNEESA